MISRQIFLYYLTETVSGRSYYVDNGQVKTTNIPTLIQAPEGWLDNKVSFGRSAKYYGINRTFANPLKFTNDGATIIRSLFYGGKGIEAPLTLIILKWNDETDIYELYYKGGLDLSKIEDLPNEGVTVNILEGGIVKLLKAYENTVFEIPCDGSIPENFQVNLDGYKFQDQFTYQINNWEGISTNNAVALSAGFINNTGDNIGIEKGDQTFDDIKSSIAVYVSDPANSNYLFSSAGAVSLRVKGSFSVLCKVNIYNQNVLAAFFTSSNAQFNILNDVLKNGESRKIDFDFTIPLAAGEKLFLIFYSNSPLVPNNFDIIQSSFTIDFTSRFKATLTWALTARDLFKLLVEKAGLGKYLTQSLLLENWLNFAVTSGFALRGDDKAVIKWSISDFFDAFNSILNGSLSNLPVSGQNDKLFFEDKKYVFDSSTVTMELGEVAELKFTAAVDYFFDLLKIGYEPQTYDEKAGQNEVNTTAQWKTPITTLQKELTLISKARTDMHGIEFTRFNFGGKSTTNNASDNSVFILNTEVGTAAPAQFTGTKPNQQDGYLGVKEINFVLFGGLTSANGTDYFTFDPLNSQFTFNQPRATKIDMFVGYELLDLSAGRDKKIDLLINGVSVDTDHIIDSGAGGLQALGLVLNPGDVISIQIDPQTHPLIPYSVVSAFFTINFISNQVRILKRATYDSITGLPNPETAYNIEDLTPKRMFERHFNFAKSTTFNLQPASFVFQTLDKNPNLSTTKAGVTITENADVPISSMGDILFYPIIAEFKTKVPINFIDLFNAAVNGHIKFQYNGKTFYGFPMEVSAKPSLNESQDWKLLLSPLNNLADLQNLDVDGLNYFDLMGYSTFIPHLCPVKFVPLNLTVPSQYHFKNMDSDWFLAQITRWAQQNKYFQPWQNDDIIKIQCQTNGLGPVQVQMIDCKGNNVGVPVILTAVPSNAVKAPNILYQGNVPLTGLAEDVYYLVLTAGVGGTVTTFISEGLWVKEDWPDTIYFEYKHDRNKQSCIFSEGYDPSIRVHAWIDNFSPESKFAVYEDQPSDIELLNGIPHRRYKLNLGIEDGVPDWVPDKMNRILLLSSVRADGNYITRDGDSKFEVQSFPGQPKRFWSIDIREAKNRDGITLTTDGQLDDTLTVVYNINTKGFGDGADSNNIVQVTKID